MLNNGTIRQPPLKKPCSLFAWSLWTDLGREGRCTLVFHVDSVCFISKLQSAGKVRPCAAICVVRNGWNKHVVRSHRNSALLHSQQHYLPSPLKRENPYHLCNTEVLKREMRFTGFTSLKVYVKTEKCWMGVGRTRGN